MCKSKKFRLLLIPLVALIFISVFFAFGVATTGIFAFAEDVEHSENSVISDNDSSDETQSSELTTDFMMSLTDLVDDLVDITRQVMLLLYDNGLTEASVVLLTIIGISLAIFITIKLIDLL